MRAPAFLVAFLWACGGPSDPGGDAAIDRDGGVADSGGRAEDCLNGVDDDLDGMPDCADADCDSGHECVPVEGGFVPGVVVGAAEECPAGLTGGDTVYHRDLVAGGCTGCGCELGDPIECEGRIAIYDDRDECDGDTAMTGGAVIATPITSACTSMPVTDTSFVRGMRATITPTETCVANGAAMLEEASWGSATRFCPAVRVGAGCAAGQVCTLRTATRCALAPGEVGCANEGVAQTWYADLDDRRACAACTCRSLGGGCDGVSVELGSDWVCGAGAAPSVGDAEKACFDPIYSPPARLIGNVAQPTSCEAASAVSGEVTPTGPVTICCEG